MDKPITITESCLWNVLKMLELPKEYCEELKKDRKRIIEILKTANLKLQLYRSWEKQRSLDVRMPIPNLALLFSVLGEQKCCLRIRSGAWNSSLSQSKYTCDYEVSIPQA